MQSLCFEWRQNSRMEDRSIDDEFDYRLAVKPKIRPSPALNHEPKFPWDSFHSWRNILREQRTQFGRRARIMFPVLFM